MAEGGATAELLVYVANELQGVFAHISRALTEYGATGELPEPTYEAEPVAAPAKRKRVKKEKAKRKPSAFNFYIKEQIAALRAKGTDDEHNNNCACPDANILFFSQAIIAFLTYDERLEGAQALSME